MRISDWSSDVLLFRSAGQAPADRDAWRDCAARSDGAEREHQVDARRRGRTRRRRPADRDDPSLLPPPHARPRPGRARAPGARRRPRPRAKACRLMAPPTPWHDSHPPGLSVRPATLWLATARLVAPATGTPK